MHASLKRSGALSRFRHGRTAAPDPNAWLTIWMMLHVRVAAKLRWPKWVCQKKCGIYHGTPQNSPYEWEDDTEQLDSEVPCFHWKKKICSPLFDGHNWQFPKSDTRLEGVTVSAENCIYPRLRSDLFLIFHRMIWKHIKRVLCYNNNMCYTFVYTYVTCISIIDVSTSSFMRYQLRMVWEYSIIYIYIYIQCVCIYIYILYIWYVYIKTEMSSCDKF